MIRGQPAEVNVVSDREGHASPDSGADRKKTNKRARMALDRSPESLHHNKLSFTSSKDP